MADKKKKSQAEKAASASKKKKRSAQKVTSQQGKSPETKNVREKTQIPVRVISSIIFISLFVLFFVMFINPDGMITSLVDKFVQGMIGRVGFIVAIPALLYLFIIHAFSGKRPVKMRTVCLLVFVLTCSGLNHAFMNPDGLQVNQNLLGVLFEGGTEYENVQSGIQQICQTGNSYPQSLDEYDEGIFVRWFYMFYWTNNRKCWDEHLST